MLVARGNQAHQHPPNMVSSVELSELPSGSHEMEQRALVAHQHTLKKTNLRNRYHRRQRIPEVHQHTLMTTSRQRRPWRQTMIPQFMETMTQCQPVEAW